MTLQKHIKGVVDAYLQGNLMEINRVMDILVFDYHFNDIEYEFSGHIISIDKVLSVLNNEVAAKYWCCIHYTVPDRKLSLRYLSGAHVQILEDFKSLEMLPSFNDIVGSTSVWVGELSEKMNQFLENIIVNSKIKNEMSILL